MTVGTRYQGMLGQQKSEIISNRVGLDIGSHTISAVEVIERGSEIIIRSARSVPIQGLKSKQDIPDTNAVIQAIRTLWSTAAFQSKKVILALDPEATYLKWLHIEAKDEEELAMTAQSAATRGAPFPASEAITDYRVLSSRGTISRNVHFVMLVAASIPAVDAMLNIADSAGLEPLAVDIGPAAVLRSFEAQKRTASPLWSGQPLAHCQIGARATSITVTRGNALEFSRTVPVGGNDFTECITEAAGVSWTEAEHIKTSPSCRLINNGTLVVNHNNEELQVSCESAVGRLSREIHRSLKFFRSQFAEGSYLGMIGAVTLSGGGALLRGIDACLREQSIEATGVINPFAGFSVASKGRGVQHVVDSAPQYTTAVGLALGDYWSMPAEHRIAA